VVVSSFGIGTSCGIRRTRLEQAQYGGPLSQLALVRNPGAAAGDDPVGTTGGWPILSLIALYISCGRSHTERTPQCSNGRSATDLARGISIEPA